MTRVFFAVLFSVVTFSSFSANYSDNSASNCGKALPTDNPGFCTSFSTVAKCYCTASGVPKVFCSSMKLIYNQMVAIYGSIDNACRSPLSTQNTTAQDCIDNWKCFLHGGVDSQGRVCSSNQQRCA